MPIDYLSYAKSTGNPADSLLAGAKFGETISGIQEQKAKNKMAAEQFQIQKDRLEKYNYDSQELSDDIESGNVDFKNFLELSVKYPEHAVTTGQVYEKWVTAKKKEEMDEKAKEQNTAYLDLSKDIETGKADGEDLIAFATKYPAAVDHIKKIYDMYSTERKQNIKEESTWMLAALQSGDTEIVIKTLEEKRDALPDDKKAERTGYTAMIKTLKDGNTKGIAQTTIALQLKVLMDNDKEFVEKYDQIKRLGMDLTKSPYEIEKIKTETGLTEAKIVETTSNANKFLSESILIGNQAEKVGVETDVMQEQRGLNLDKLTADIGLTTEQTNLLKAQTKRVADMTPTEIANLKKKGNFTDAEIENLKEKTATIKAVREFDIEKLRSDANLGDAQANFIKEQANRLSTMTPYEIEKLIKDASLTKQQAEVLKEQITTIKGERPFKLSKLRKEIKLDEAQAKLLGANADRITKMTPAEVNKLVKEGNLTEAQAQKIGEEIVTIKGRRQIDIDSLQEKLNLNKAQIKQIEAATKRVTELTPKEVDKLIADTNLTKEQGSKLKSEIGVAQAKVLKLNAETLKTIYEAEAIKEGKGQVDPELKFKFEKQLRDEYNKMSGDYQEMIRMNRNIQIANPDGTGDLALVTSFMKLLDPGSVVRETEFANALKASGLAERLKAYKEQISKGDILSEATRERFKAQAAELIRAASTVDGEMRGYYSKIGENYGLDSENIFVFNQETEDVDTEKVIKKTGKPKLDSFLQGLKDGR